MYRSQDTYIFPSGEQWHDATFERQGGIWNPRWHRHSVERPRFRIRVRGTFSECLSPFRRFKRSSSYWNRWSDDFANWEARKIGSHIIKCWGTDGPQTNFFRLDSKRALHWLNMHRLRLTISKLFEPFDLCAWRKKKIDQTRDKSLISRTCRESPSGLICTNWQLRHIRRSHRRRNK